MPEWRKVPKTLSGRLREIHAAIEELVKAHQPSFIKEYFGISWEDLNHHARDVLHRYEKFIEDQKDTEDGPEQSLVTFYLLGFLTGVRFTNEEDHEPPEHN